MADKTTYSLIGKSIIIGAIITSLISFVQISFDPFFLRIGDDRIAFGNLLRTNGLFRAEYYNAYYLIIAITWTLVTVKNNLAKIALVCLFSLGVISTFISLIIWIIIWGGPLVLLIKLIQASNLEQIRDLILLGGGLYLSILIGICAFFFFSLWLPFSYLG